MVDDLFLRVISRSSLPLRLHEFRGVLATAPADGDAAGIKWQAPWRRHPAASPRATEWREAVAAVVDSGSDLPATCAHGGWRWLRRPLPARDHRRGHHPPLAPRSTRRAPAAPPPAMATASKPCASAAAAAPAPAWAGAANGRAAPLPTAATPTAVAALGAFSPSTLPPATLLRGYLARVGLAPAPADQSPPPAFPPPTAATLSRLHRAHLSALPFEHVSLLAAGGPVANTLDGAWAKLVAASPRRGGWCLEHHAVLGAVCVHLGYAVTPRGGWILKRERRAAAALFGLSASVADGGDGGGGGRGGGGGGRAPVAPAEPAHHLALEVGVPGAAGANYLVDVGDGRSFADPQPLRLAGGGWAADGAGGGAVAQLDGTWWRVAPLDVDPALAGVAAAVDTGEGNGGRYRLVQYAEASRAAPLAAGESRRLVAATPPADAAAWTSHYVLDAGAAVARLADMDDVRDHFQFDAASPFRAHRPAHAPRRRRPHTRGARRPAAQGRLLHAAVAAAARRGR